MNIILGKSKTGKSKYIFDEIKKDIDMDKKVILFVPSQCKMMTENNYMSENNLPGIIGVKITTINDYVIDKLKDYNLNISDSFISNLDRKIIISKCLANTKDSLTIFNKTSNKEGFLDLIDIYVDIFNKQNISIKQLGDLKDKRLSAKLKDIFAIYDAYKKEIEDKYIDSVKEIDIFLKDILPLEDLKDCNVYFDEYNNFSAKELEFLKAFEKKANKVTISLDTDISCVEDIYSGNTNEIFNITNTTFKAILKIVNEVKSSAQIVHLYENNFNANENLKLIANNYFENIENKIDTENLEIYAVKNMYEEIEKVASIISKKIKQGYKYNDICIYTSDIKKYSKVVESIMQKYGISIQIDDSFLIKDSRLSNYISLFQEIVINGITTTNVIEILKLGLNDIPDEDVFLLENYIREFNISRFALKKPFYINNEKNREKIYDIQRLNEVREKILDIFEYNISNDDIEVKDIINIIYEHLAKNKILDNWNEFLQEELNSNQYEINQYNIQSQVWDKICDIFDSIYKVYYNEKIKVKDFYKIFAMLLKNVLVKSVPATLDQVILSDINSAKLGPKKICFFVGVNEDEFPKKESEDYLFSDLDIERLESNGIKLKETSISRLNMQMFNLYKALNNVTVQEYFLFNSSTLEGKSLRPSGIIKRLKEITNITILGEVTKDEEDINITEIYSKEKAFLYAVSLLKKIESGEIEDKEDYSKFAALYDYITEDVDINQILKYQKKDDNLKEDTLNMIYSNNINTSISKLELFKRCPFSYYMKYILKINPRKEFEITNLDTGNFMHNVIEEFSKYLLKNNIYYHDIIDLNEKLKEEYNIVLEDIISKTLEENFKNKKNSVKFEVLKLKLTNTMKKVVSVIAKSFNQSDFKPYGYEMEFSANGEFRPIVIDIGQGKRISIIGKIDRVDTLEVGNKTYVRVIDYKSSSKELDIKDIKEGISLQLITYIYALMENKKFLPAAMLYFNLSDKLVNLNDYFDSEDKIKAEVIKSLRMKGLFLKDIDIIKKMDKKLDSGNERLIDISKTSIEKGSSKTLEEEEFNTLCKEARETLKELSKAIIQGVVAINPNKKADHCKYCDYYLVCRKNSCL